MATRDVTSNGTAFTIALGAVVAAGVVWSVIAFAFGAAAFTAALAEFESEGGFEAFAADDAELGVLESACAAGDMAACDDLYFASPFGSDAEAFASTCGNTLTVEQYGTCAEGGVLLDELDEGELAALRTACGAGDGVACDELYLSSPIGSDAEDFGSTCGGTSEPVYGRCATLEDLTGACTVGDLGACDRLYLESPFGSDEEEFGSTCGGRREPTAGGCSG